VNQQFWSLQVAIANQRDQNRDQRIRRLARRQHGVVSRDQLLQLRLTPSGLAHWRRRGWLHPVHRGVFAVGPPELSQYGRWMAAVLTCGRGALLSHQSAAELWGIRRAVPGRIEVTLPQPGKRRASGLIVHRRIVLGPQDCRARHGIPATSPARTLADLALRLPAPQLEAAVNEADRLDLIEPERLRKAVEEMGGERGVSTLSRLLDRRTFRLTDSELERRFLRLVRSAGLPMPQTGCEINGFRVDFFWPHLGLVVETDGLRYHRTAAAQARDRVRDQAHTAAGLTPLRFTHAQIRFEPEYVTATLRRVVERLAKRTRL
jgi:very-short-patch-repair endonuclease